jgi:hypothetical protein
MSLFHGTRVLARRSRLRLVAGLVTVAATWLPGCGTAGGPDAGSAVPAPPPLATTLDVPPRTWVPRPLPQPDGESPIPYGRGAKHSRVLFDSKRGRMVLAGGDVLHPNIGNGNGNSTVWAIDLERGNRWERLHDWCAGPGQLMPGTPDSVSWVYASKHDQAVMLPGFYFITQGNHYCPQAREVADAVVYDFGDNTWKPTPFRAPPNGWGGDMGASFAVYDPPTDSVYRFRNGGTVEIFSMTGATRAGSSGTFDEGGNRDQSTIDVQGRNIYRIARDRRALLRYSITRGGVVESIPLPSQWVRPADDLETYLGFDSRHRVVLLPNVESFGGKVLGLGVYHVDTKKWDWESVGLVNGLLVRGNVFGYDEKNDVFFLGAGHPAEGTLPPVTVFWLYRYR